jgi:pimeloyl-ACP methyl ester carboxylesterase
VEVIVNLPKPCGGKAWLGRASFTICLSIILFMFFVTIVTAKARQQQNTKSVGAGEFDPPGKLVDVGGWRLHLNCAGADSKNVPTVVLEAGAGDLSLDWSLVQPEVTRFARICSYDRAGVGWSDLGPRPRTFRQIAYELHTLLHKAGIPAPYILVGHSVGGLIVRTFAAAYPKEVAGMVLVDATSEDTQLSVGGKLTRIRKTSQGRAIPAVRTNMTARERELSPAQRQEIEGFMKEVGPPKLESPYTKLPPDIQRTRMHLMSSPRFYAGEDDPYWGEEFAEFYAEGKRAVPPLGEIPLMVLIGGKADKTPPGVPEEEWQRLNDEKRMQKREFARLSRNSRVKVDPLSGHHIQLDNPDLVVEAIRQVVEAVRHRTKLALAP